MPTLGATAASNEEAREGGTSISPLSTVFPGLGPGLDFAGRGWKGSQLRGGAAGQPRLLCAQVAGGMWNAAHVPLATARTKDSLMGGVDN